MNEEEFQDHVANLIALQKRVGTRHEAGAVKEAARLGAVLASHDDTTAEQVATSKAHGVGFAEFPTTLEAAQACRDAGIAVMMGAPNLVRGGSHSGNVAASELSQAGVLDIISSDYVPSALLLSAFRLGDLWSDLPRAIASVTAAPARAANLNDRGTLETGKRADVIRVRRVGDLPALRGVWVKGERVS
jgi:alpha-D-ribose 1-methylphosphonate 5-triphosphate diphosphatase